MLAKNKDLKTRNLWPRLLDVLTRHVFYGSLALLTLCPSLAGAESGFFWINDSQFCYNQVSPSPGVYDHCVNKIDEQTYTDEYTSFTIPVWSDGVTTWAGNPYAQQQTLIALDPTAKGIGAAWLLDTLAKKQTPQAPSLLVIQ